MYSLAKTEWFHWEKISKPDTPRVPKLLLVVKYSYFGESKNEISTG